MEDNVPLANKECRLANSMAKSSKRQLTFVLKVRRDFKEKETKRKEGHQSKGRGQASER